MKEATGELSGTVITVVAIAAIAAIFTIILLPMMKRNIALSTACSSAGDGDYEQSVEGEYTITCADGQCVYTEEGEGGGTSTKQCDTDNDDAH